MYDPVPAVLGGGSKPALLTQPTSGVDGRVRRNIGETRRIYIRCRPKF
jgi:hypothetical protein